MVLARSANPGDVLGGLAAGMPTLEVACAVEPEPRLCAEGNTRQTGTWEIDADRDGSATFDV